MPLVMRIENILENGHLFGEPWICTTHGWSSIEACLKGTRANNPKVRKLTNGYEDVEPDENGFRQKVTFYEEPDYIAQNGEFANMGGTERKTWFDVRCAEAKKEGSTFFRCSVDDAENPTLALIEGWKEQPKDQGEIRWRLTKDAGAT